jgi:hypothetical protein
MKAAAAAATLATALIAPGLPAPQAQGAAAAAPMSAIPWLSRSLDEVERPVERPRARPPRLRPEDAEIAVTPLDGIALDAVGLISPEEAGLPRDLWGPSSALRVRAAILAHPDMGVPAARALFKRLLLVEADPPQAAGAGAQVLVARVDRLLERGALAEAEALIERAGAETPDLFRRMFDVGLLLNRAEPACEALRRNPQLSPTLPARIFCLARDGDWNAAEITLTLGGNMGEISDEEELALARFLDPELFEHLPPAAPPEPFTPLDFLLREAVGMPRPSGPLPPAFLHHDLADYLPMRMRITAAERLVLEDVVEPAVLFEAYRAGAPAASGGFWDRAAAVQALDAAIATGEGIGEALLGADAALAERGLRVALARQYGRDLKELDPAGLDGEARRALVELLLLAGDARAAARAAGRRAGQGADPTLSLLLALGGAGTPGRLPPASAADPRLAAALEALTGRASAPGPAATPSPDPLVERLLELGEDGRTGEMLLAALALVGDGPQADPSALGAAVAVLDAAGQRKAARRIALETVLLARPTAP